jgi:hypothetical protein
MRTLVLAAALACASPAWAATEVHFEVTEQDSELIVQRIEVRR